MLGIRSQIKYSVCLAFLVCLISLPCFAQPQPPIPVTHKLTLKNLAFELVEAKSKAIVFTKSQRFEGTVLGATETLLVMRHEASRFAQKIAYIPFEKIDAIVLDGKSSE